MPSAMVDTAYPHSDNARALARMLGNPYADILPIRLWCWGLDTGREKGVFQATAKELAQIVRFESDPEVLLQSFLSCGVIEKISSDDRYRIIGWDRNARFFKERKRLRKLHKTRAPRSKPRVVDACATQPSSSSSSSSSLPPSEERERPKTDRAIKTLHYGTYQAILKSVRGKIAPPSPTGKDKFALAAICDAALGETGKVIEAYIRDDNPFYAKTGWALRTLEYDLGKIYQRVTGNNMSPAARAAEQQARNKAQLEEYL